MYEMGAGGKEIVIEDLYGNLWALPQVVKESDKVNTSSVYFGLMTITESTRP